MDNGICGVCGGEKWVKNDEGERVPCRCLDDIRLRRMFELMGIPPRFRKADLSQFVPEARAGGTPFSNKRDVDLKRAARDAVEGYIEAIPSLLAGSFLRSDSTSQYNSLLLEGGENSGKSLLAACITIGGAKLRSRVKIFEWSQLLGSCYDFDGEEYDDLTHEMNRKDQVVVIENVDEMYERTGSQMGLPASVLRRLNSMFMKRWKTGIPTVITTSQHRRSVISGKYGTAFSATAADALHVMLPGEEGDE